MQSVGGSSVWLQTEMKFGFPVLRGCCREAQHVHHPYICNTSVVGQFPGFSGACAGVDGLAHSWTEQQVKQQNHFQLLQPRHYLGLLLLFEIHSSFYKQCENWYLLLSLTRIIRQKQAEGSNIFCFIVASSLFPPLFLRHISLTLPASFRGKSHSTRLDLEHQHSNLYAISGELAHATVPLLPCVIRSVTKQSSPVCAASQVCGT